MASGVILTTGNVANAPGPNSTILSDGSLAWPGDSDLVTALGNATAVYNNATVLEFDFTPINPQFSFDFIFASEEYGTFQCQPFPDAFAFLLTNTTAGTPTTNLAVLPGTTIPVSVETIRDNAYNNICASVNPSFFGNFYGFSNSPNAPTNFFGQTVLMNASAVLIPGNVYHIKLVIADRLDTNNDSAVFISGTSFNLGQDVLGPDKTIANNTAPCFGQSYTITSGLNPADYTFTWSNSAGTVLGSSPDLTVTTAGIYKLEYLKNGSTCLPEINSIIIEYRPEIKTVQPVDIYKCNTGSSPYSFNIAINNPLLLAGAVPANTAFPPLPATTTLISYFADPALTIPISSPYSATANTTVYVKITNTLTGCFTSKSFQLLLAPPITVLPTLPNVTQCEDSPGSGLTTIILNSFNTIALNGQSPAIYGVSYYISQADANAGTPTISAAGYSLANNAVVYVRIENKTDPTGCPTFTSFTVLVPAKPNITDTPKNVIICPNDVYILPVLVAGEQYWTKVDGPSGGGIQLFAGYQVTLPVLPEPNPVTIYVYLSNGTCKDEKSFTVTFLDLSLITGPDPNYCGSFTVPSSEYASFYSAPHSAANPNPPLLAPGTIIQPSTTPVTIYLYYETLPPAIVCRQEVPFTIDIRANPVLSGFNNVFRCSTETYTLPALPNANDFVSPATANVQYYADANHTIVIPAGTVISASTIVFVHATSGPLPCTGDKLFKVAIGLDKPLPQTTCKAYTLPNVIFGKYYKLSGGPTVAGQVTYAPGTIITESQVVWLYEVAPSTCVAEYPITITIKLPKINPVAAVSVCAGVNYTLPALQIVPNNTNVNPIQEYVPLFYNTAADGSGTTIAPGTVISSSQTVYIVASDGLTNGCRDNKPIVITINALPSLIYDPNIINCTAITLPPQPGFTYYYGPNKTGGIIPTTTSFNADTTVYAYGISNTVPACEINIPVTIKIDYTVAIQYSNVLVCNNYILPAITQAAGENNQYFDGPHIVGSPLPQVISAGTPITSTKTIYVYNFKNARKPCDAETSFTVTVNPNPVLPNFPAIISCGDYTLPALTLGNYYSQTGGLGTQYLAGDKIKSNQTVYVFAGNSAIPAANCVTDNKSFLVTIYRVDILQDITQCSNYILPALTFGNYFTGPLGTGTPKFAGNAITTSQTIYIYKKIQTSTSPIAFCDSQSQFIVTIIPQPVAYPVPLVQRTFCDTDGKNDGDFFVDLSTYSAIILNPIIPPFPANPQVGSQFTVLFYEPLFNANANPPIDPITAPTILRNVFVRVSNTLTPNCYDIQPLTIVINKMPEPTNPENAFICLDPKTNLILQPINIDSGLGSPNTFLWTDSNNVIIGVGATLPNITVPGIYSLQVTSPAGCITRKVTKVAFSQAAIAGYALSENFSDNQYITITATGSGGNYEYQLDDNNYQNSPVLENVPYGPHVVNVRDINGCGITPVPVLVVNYPKYFTPNGDGINDNWNVIGLEKDLKSNIFIYDRFGKLLSEIKPSGLGWDGMYHNNLLPSTDYWFVVNYSENGLDREFKAHFTLKR